MTVETIAGGCAIQVHLRLRDGYEEVLILAFDERGDAWQLVLLDSEHGNVIAMSGHSTTDGLEFIGLHPRRDRLLVDRVSLRRTGTGWVLRTETASAYGAPWRLLQVTRFTRPA